MKNKKSFKKLLTNLGNTIDVDIINNVDIESVESFQDIANQIEASGVLTEDVIYYSNAIDYLKEHDASLMRSIEIADGLGYDLKSITSEVLASLLKTENNREDFYDLRSKIDAFFEEN